MGNRQRHFMSIGHLQACHQHPSVLWNLPSGSNSIHTKSAQYEPPFGLSPLVRRCLIALGLIDGYIEGLDEYLAIQEEQDRRGMR